MPATTEEDMIELAPEADVEETQPNEVEAESINTEPEAPKPKTKRTARFESWVALRPDGTKVKVTRNIDTGEHKVTEIK